jgi:hypothetical protein
MTRKYCNAALHYNSVEVVKYTDVLQEQLGGVIDFPMKFFTEGNFLQCTKDEKIYFFNGIINGKWQKPRADMSKPIHLDKGKFFFFSFTN